MICSTMLDQMLEADLSELDGAGDSALAQHVRECARCRAVAGQLVRETQSLARLVDRAAGLRVVRRIPRSYESAWHRLALTGAVAALSLLALREWPRGAHLTSEAPLSGGAVAPRAQVTESTTAPPTDARARTDSRTAPRARPRRDAGFVDRATASRTRLTEAARTMATEMPVSDRVEEPVSQPIAVKPVRLDVPPSSQPLGDRVAVDPPAGVRANVVRTADPNVTVVWLYR